MGVKRFDQSKYVEIRRILDRSTTVRSRLLLQHIYKHYFEAYKEWNFFVVAPELSRLQRLLEQEPNQLPEDAIEITQRIAAKDVGADRTWTLAVTCPRCGEFEQHRFDLRWNGHWHRCSECGLIYGLEYVEITDLNIFVNEYEDQYYQIDGINNTGFYVSRQLGYIDNQNQVIDLEVGERILLVYDNGYTNPIGTTRYPVIGDNGNVDSGYTTHYLISGSELQGNNEEGYESWSEIPSSRVGSNENRKFIVVTVVAAVAVVVGILFLNSLTPPHSVVTQSTTLWNKAKKPAEKMLALQPGQEITATGRSADNEWVQVIWEGKSAWVENESISLVKPIAALPERRFTQGFSGKDYDIDQNGSVSCQDFKTPDALEQMKLAVADGMQLDKNGNGIPCE